MEEEDSSEGNLSSVSEDIPNDDIASPDPVADTVAPATSKSFLADERSQTPLQDEVIGGDAVAAIISNVEEVSISQTTQSVTQQDVINVESAKSCDDEVLKQTVRDDHGELELDYDEEDQSETGPTVTTDISTSTNMHQKTVGEEEKEDGEEKVGQLSISPLMI